METRAEDVDRRCANPPAAGPRGRRAADRHAMPASRCARWRTSCAASLEDIGIRDRLSPLVLVVGHGSDQSQQPARVGPRLRCVRRRTRRAERAGLRADGQRPARAPAAGRRRAVRSTRATWFVGAQAQHLRQHGHVLRRRSRSGGHASRCSSEPRDAIDTTRRREAHERCRRFDAVPRWYPPLAALAHVQARAADLAQPRPEHGHATNAFCVIGRRTRTRGLFLDRRAFLVCTIRRVGSRWRDPRARLGGGRARRRRDQPRASLQLRRSDRLRLRHQAAAQRHVAARRDGWRAKRSAHRPAVADGRDPRADAPDDRRRSRARIASVRVVAGQPGARTARATTAGSGSRVSIRVLARCGSCGRTGFVAHTPRTCARSGHGRLGRRGIRAKRGFLQPVAIVQEASA